MERRLPHIRKASANSKGFISLWVLVVGGLVTGVMAIILVSSSIAQYRSQNEMAQVQELRMRERTMATRLSGFWKADADRILGLGRYPASAYLDRHDKFVKIMELPAGQNTLINLDSAQVSIQAAQNSGTYLDRIGLVSSAFAEGDQGVSGPTDTVDYSGLDDKQIQLVRAAYTSRPSNMSTGDFNSLRRGCLTDALGDEMPVFVKTGSSTQKFYISCRLNMIQLDDGHMRLSESTFRVRADNSTFSNALLSRVKIATAGGFTNASYALPGPPNPQCNVDTPPEICCKINKGNCIGTGPRDDDLMFFLVTGPDLSKDLEPLDTDTPYDFGDLPLNATNNQILVKHFNTSLVFKVVPDRITGKAVVAKDDLALRKDLAAADLTIPANNVKLFNVGFDISSEKPYLGSFKVSAVDDNTPPLAHNYEFTFKAKGSASAPTTKTFNIAPNVRKVDYLFVLDMTQTEGKFGVWVNAATAMVNNFMTKIAGSGLDVNIGFISADGTTDSGIKVGPISGTNWADWEPYAPFQTSGKRGALLSRSYRLDNGAFLGKPRFINLPANATAAQISDAKNEIQYLMNDLAGFIRDNEQVAGASTGLLGLESALSDANIGMGGYNHDFLRPDADLYALIVSDSDEAADPYAREVPKANEGRDYYMPDDDGNPGNYISDIHSAAFSETYLYVFKEHVMTPQELAFLKNPHTRWKNASVDELNFEFRLSRFVNRMRTVKAGKSVHLDALAIPYDQVKYPLETTCGAGISDCEMRSLPNIQLTLFGKDVTKADVARFRTWTAAEAPTLPADFRYKVYVKGYNDSDLINAKGYCALNSGYKSCVHEYCKISGAGCAYQRIDDTDMTRPARLPGYAIAYGEATKRLGGKVYDLGETSKYGDVFNEIGTTMTNSVNRIFDLPSKPVVGSEIKVIFDSTALTQCSTSTGCNGFFYNADSNQISLVGMTIDSTANHTVTVSYQAAP